MRLSSTSYQTNQPLDNATFKFDKKKFPNAKVRLTILTSRVQDREYNIHQN